MNVTTHSEIDVLILVNRIKDMFDQLLVCHKNKVNTYFMIIIIIDNCFIL